MRLGLGRGRNYVAKGPFGEELSAGVGIRSAALGYGADSTRQKFTGRERDDETGLDFFGTRYYAPVQGRFTSVDGFNPILGKQGADEKEEAEKEFRQWLLQPAHWNRYTYCLNNPMNCIDPDGMNPITVNLNIIWDANTRYTDDEKERIRQAYIELAKKRFANVEINFKINETTGTAADLSGNRRRVTSGLNNDALNVFFTKSPVEKGAFAATEVTDYKNKTVFITTHNKGSDPEDLVHGFIHAFGVSQSTGYSKFAAEATTLTHEVLLAIGRNGPIFYSDDRSPRREIVPGYVSAKVAPVYRTVPYELTTFDIIRDGARRFK